MSCSEEEEGCDSSTLPPSHSNLDGAPCFSVHLTTVSRDVRLERDDILKTSDYSDITIFMWRRSIFLAETLLEKVYCAYI